MSYLEIIVLSGLNFIFGERSGGVDRTICAEPEDSESESGRLLICIEYKSTHNLRLPRTVEEIVRRYNEWKEKQGGDDNDGGGACSEGEDLEDDAARGDNEANEEKKPAAET